MKLRFLFYVFCFFIFIACGEKEKKVDTTVVKEANKKVADKTSGKPKENSSESNTQLTLEDKIKRIKSNFSTIENQLASFEKKVKEKNVGGGVLKKEAYFTSNVPQKVMSGNYGEHGSIAQTFYLHDNKLFFVFEEEFSEAGMNGPFTKKEKRYYIDNGELIRVLAKEKTSKSYTIDLSTVQNINVTTQWKSKQNIVSEFEKILRETSTSLVETKVGLDNGRWISTDDPKSGIEIKDGTFVMFYKGVDTSPNSIFNYELYEEAGVEYLRLKNDTEQMVYGLLEYSDESMVLSYLGRGNTLTYRKEK